MAAHERETILVVDDDFAFRDFVRDLLERIGYAVVETGDGSLVTDLVETERPTAVLLDVNLPGLNGYEVCHRLRQQPTADLGIIFVSGSRTESHDRTAGLLIGADDYLSKPFDPSELVARVRRFSRGRTPAADATDRGGRLASLTRREREILFLLADGLPHDAVAEQLVISPKTVATHIQHVLAKLGARSRAQAVSIALHERPPAGR